jgi:hypothetical protein
MSFKVITSGLVVYSARHHDKLELTLAASDTIVLICSRNNAIPLNLISSNGLDGETNYMFDRTSNQAKIADKANLDPHNPSRLTLSNSSTTAVSSPTDRINR